MSLGLVGKVSQSIPLRSVPYLSVGAQNVTTACNKMASAANEYLFAYQRTMEHLGRKKRSFHSSCNLQARRKTSAPTPLATEEEKIEIEVPKRKTSRSKKALQEQDEAEITAKLQEQAESKPKRGRKSAKTTEDKPEIEDRKPQIFEFKTSEEVDLEDAKIGQQTDESFEMNEPRVPHFTIASSLRAKKSETLSSHQTSKYVLQPIQVPSKYASGAISSRSHSTSSRISSEFDRPFGMDPNQFEETSMSPQAAENGDSSSSAMTSSVYPTSNLDDSSLSALESRSKTGVFRSPSDRSELVPEEVLNTLTNVEIPEYWPHKFVVTGLEQGTTEKQIRDAISEAVHPRQVHVTFVEFFNEQSSGKRRTHAFVGVNSEAELHEVMNYRIKAFGVYLNGNRSSIVPVNEKAVLQLVTNPSFQHDHIVQLLDYMGINDLMLDPSIVGDYNEPMVNSSVLESYSPSSRLSSSSPMNSRSNHHQNQISIFSPSNMDGESTGKAWITFPNHKSAFIAHHLLSRCHPKAIKIYWSQKAPTNYEQAIRARDALAIENAQLRSMLSAQSPGVAPRHHGEPITIDTEPMMSNQRDHTSGDLATSGDQISVLGDLSLDTILHKHITKVISMNDYNLTQVATSLKISIPKLTKLLTDLKKKGFEIPSL